MVDAKTETVIRSGFLKISCRQAGALNGSWLQSGRIAHPVAVTGYTLMAFLAAGQLPNEGEYGRAVKNGDPNIS